MNSGRNITTTIVLAKKKAGRPKTADKIIMSGIFFIFIMAANENVARLYGASSIFHDRLIYKIVT
jgi:hypothetical protein